MPKGVKKCRNCGKFSRCTCRVSEKGVESYFKSEARSAAIDRADEQTPIGEEPTPKKASGLAVKIRASQTEKLPHIVVEAYAGTGKTFVQIVGTAWVFGQPIWEEIREGLAEMFGADPDDFDIVPSEEQQAIWDSMALSRGKVSSIVYCAFNKSVVREFSEKWGWLVTLLQERLGINLQFATINSLGNKAFCQSAGRVQVTERHTENLLCQITGKDIWYLRKKDPEWLAAVIKLTGLVKLTLSGWMAGKGFVPESLADMDFDVLDKLCSFYDVGLDNSRIKVYEATIAVLKESAQLGSEIDFNDQNWLPVILNLPIPKADLVLIDEAQDLSRCKQEFCLKVGRRVMMVGDKNQAIYSFAGADTDSIPRMKKMLGVETSLRLTETHRCGKAIVKEALRYVPGFKAHPDNSEGLVRNSTLDTYHTEAEDGDMVLCRVNAPLVSQALRFIRDGRKALIRGRDFGSQLINFVARQDAEDVPDLIERVDFWVERELAKENKKRNPSESRQIAIRDRRACIEAFCAEAKTLQQVTEKIEIVFAGRVCPGCGKHYNEIQEECYNCKTGNYITLANGARVPEKVKLLTPKGVIFSSVHKAKGLENTRVFIIRTAEAPMPHPMSRQPWERQSERNLIYVAITRAIEELVWITS